MVAPMQAYPSHIILFDATLFVNAYETQLFRTGLYRVSEQLLLQLEHYNRYLTWGGYGLALLIVCYIVYQGFFKSHKKSEQK